MPRPHGCLSSLVALEQPLWRSTRRDCVSGFRAIIAAVFLWALFQIQNLNWAHMRLPALSAPQPKPKVQSDCVARSQWSKGPDRDTEKEQHRERAHKGERKIKVERRKRGGSCRVDRCFLSWPAGFLNFSPVLLSAGDGAIAAPQQRRILGGLANQGAYTMDAPSLPESLQAFVQILMVGVGLDHSLLLCMGCGDITTLFRFVALCCGKALVEPRGYLYLLLGVGGSLRAIVVVWGGVLLLVCSVALWRLRFICCRHIRCRHMFQSTIAFDMQCWLLVLLPAVVILLVSVLPRLQAADDTAVAVEAVHRVRLDALTSEKRMCSACCTRSPSPSRIVPGASAPFHNTRRAPRIASYRGPLGQCNMLKI